MRKLRSPPPPPVPCRTAKVRAQLFPPREVEAALTPPARPLGNCRAGCSRLFFGLNLAITYLYADSGRHDYAIGACRPTRARFSGTVRIEPTCRLLPFAETW